MATVFGTAECTRLCTEVWKEWHMGKIILLCIGIGISAPCFYIAFTMSFSEQAPYIISFCFLGAAGLLIIIYSLFLFWISFHGESVGTGSNRTNGSLSRSNEYLLFFSNSSQPEPQVYVQIQQI